MRTTLQHRLASSIILGMVLFLFVTGCGAAPPPNDVPRAVSGTVGAPVAPPQSLTLAPRVQPPTATATAGPTVCIREQYDEKQPDGSVKHVQYLCDGTFQTQVIATAPPISAAMLAEKIDAAWTAGDWPQVIVLLKRANPVDSCKLYAAYFNYGQALLAQGDKVNAAVQFQSAASLTGCGGEAAQAIRALTPSPTPSSTPLLLPTATATSVIVIVSTPPPNSGIRIGAICRDGWRSSSTGSGTCSRHGGVAYWLYK